jgi:hypothetical protein
METPVLEIVFYSVGAIDMPTFSPFLPWPHGIYPKKTGKNQALL